MVLPIKGSKILNQDNLQNQLEENGFVVFPLLSKDEVNQLIDFFWQNHPQKLEGLYATAHHPDIGFRGKMSDFIHEIVAEKVNLFFTEIQMLGGTFMVKFTGEKGMLPPHQDWNIVDEKNFASYNLWIPLVDVDETNGSIQVIEGSHIWKEGFRGPNLQGPFAAEAQTLWPKMKILKLKAGEVLVYDHRLLHSSGENKSEEPREVIVFGVIPKHAPMRFFYEEQGKVVAYNCNKDFYLKQNPWEGPKGLKKIKKSIFERIFNYG